MRHYLITCITLLSILSANAQEKKALSGWTWEVGPSFALPIRAFHSVTTFGIGADIKASRPVSSVDNLTVGGRASYNIFFRKKLTGFTGKESAINNVGIFASFQYIVVDKLILEADIGLGITSGWFNTLGLARGGFIGYKLPDSKRNVKVGVFMNRITFATLHAGIKGSIEL